MKTFNWLWVAVAALSLITTNCFAQEETESKFISIESIDGTITAETKAKISTALDQKLKFAVQVNENGERQIIITDVIPSDAQQFTTADLTALMLQSGASDELFDAKSEAVARWALKNGFSPAEQLLKNSVAHQMGLNPSAFDAHPDFFKWVQANDIHMQAKAFGHTWQINKYGKPVVSAPGMGRQGFNLLTENNALNANGKMESCWVYSRAGLVQVADPIIEEESSEGSIEEPTNMNVLDYNPALVAVDDVPVTYAGANLAGTAVAFTPSTEKTETESTTGSDKVKVDTNPGSDAGKVETTPGSDAGKVETTPDAGKLGAPDETSRLEDKPILSVADGSGWLVRGDCTTDKCCNDYYNAETNTHYSGCKAPDSKGVETPKPTTPTTSETPTLTPPYTKTPDPTPPSTTETPDPTPPSTTETPDPTPPSTTETPTPTTTPTSEAPPKANVEEKKTKWVSDGTAVIDAFGWTIPLSDWACEKAQGLSQTIIPGCKEVPNDEGEPTQQ